MDSIIKSNLKSKVDKQLQSFKDLEMGDVKKQKIKRNKYRPAIKEDNFSDD